MATIAVHNGGGKYSRKHNARDAKTIERENQKSIAAGKKPHIDINGSHEVWIDEDPRQVYEELFGGAVREYNEKQKRSDRKIDDYYKSVCKNKQKHSVYEVVMGVYGANLPEKDLKTMYMQYVADWERRNPNLRLIGAYYHADEESPHVHLDYVPVATGYSRGMSIQASMDKALRQQGYTSHSPKVTAQMAWEASERDYLTSLCASRGISVEAGKGGKKHLEKDLYAKQQDVERQKEYVASKMAQISLLTEQLEEKSNEIEKREIEANLAKQEYELLKGTIDEQIARAQERAGKAYGFDRIEAIKEQKAWKEAKEATENIERLHNDKRLKITTLDEEIEM